MKKEKDPYRVDALPTCNHALSVCQQERKCIKLYEDFKLNCKVRDNKCRMDDRNLCHKSWANLRRSPMFGCICPINHMKKKCDRIFSVINHNPCVDTVLFMSRRKPAQTSSELKPDQDSQKASWPPPSNSNNLYPFFLLPPSAHSTIRTHRVELSTSTGTSTAIVTGTSTDADATATDTTALDSHSVEETLFTSLRFPELVGLVIPATDNASASFDYGLGNSIVENPLVDADNGLDAHADHDHISVSVLKNSGKSAVGMNFTHYPEDLDRPQNGVSAQHQKYPSSTDHGRGDKNEASKVVFQSTCHLAMESCNNNYHCRMSLAPILHHCDLSRCNRNSCMEALQGFYRKPSLPWNVEIAFCLCKKTDNKQDACLIAQEKLHPVCAQRIEGSPQPTCLSLAEVCRESNECRERLEYYEQSCAVDSVTKKCAGPPAECRAAMLGILGTDLRTTCACKGTDMTQLYECLGWQRLLWVNPCVVESQRDFHMKKAAEQAMMTTLSTTQATTTEKLRTRPSFQVNHITVISATEASLQTRKNTIAELIPPPQAFVPTTTTTTTTILTTTTAVATTTIPPKYCVVQRPQFPDQYIKEGSFKRIYHEDEFECSDVCECEIGEKLSCKTICIDRMPCKTEFAYYNHAAPAYQAFRGRCLCYSGRFICMKPAPGDYTLPQGVYIFLGYSEVDERELNKNQTRIVVQDVVRILQNFIKEEATNGTLCSLELFNSTRENVIIAGKLSEEVDYSTLSPVESLVKEKDECAELLEIISDRINARNPDFISHLLLSIFKMAQVEIVQVEPSSVSSKVYLTSIHFLLAALFVAIILPKTLTTTS